MYSDVVNVCVYVSFGSTVRLRIFRCFAMGSAVLFVMRSRLLKIIFRRAWSEQCVVLPGFSVRLLCFV